jgi:hypothetical protein
MGIARMIRSAELIRRLIEAHATFSDGGEQPIQRILTSGFLGGKWFEKHESIPPRHSPLLMTPPVLRHSA